MSAEHAPGNQHILGVLASGGGSNFRAIVDATRDGRMPEARVGLLVTDRQNIGALAIAETFGIQRVVLDMDDNDERNFLLHDIFKSAGVELGVGAGYLKMLDGQVLDHFDVLNIHPAPLPRFGGKGMYGRKAHQAVIDAGMKWSGPTVHLMNEVFDEGQILAHVQVPVLAGDSADDLAARILPYEHDLYWRVIAQQLARGRHPEFAR